jgi:hypothetical protein
MLGSLLAGVITVAARYTRLRSRNYMIGALLITLTIAADLLGLFTRLDLSHLNEFDVIFIEHHFSAVLGQAERLAAGHRLGELVIPRYGLLLQGVLAAVAHGGRPLTMGETIWVLQGLQLLYLSVAGIVLARHSRRNYLLCLFASLLIIPWYYFANNAVLYPNESAWRTLSMPLALLAISLTWRVRLFRSSLVLGLLSGCFLLLNVESGLAASGGLLAALAYRTRPLESGRQLKQLIRACLLFALGIAAAIQCFVLGWRLVFGYWLSAAVPRDIFQRMLFWSSSGFAGLYYPGDVMPLALLAWSIFTVVKWAVAPNARACRSQAVRLTASVICMLWLPYYANRPAFWNLSGFAILYAIPAIDAARICLVALRRNRLLTPAALAAFAVTAVITVPTVIDTVRFNAQNSSEFQVAKSVAGLLSGTDRTDTNKMELSGVVLSKALAEHLKAQTTILVASKSPVFLTLHSYLIPKVAGMSSRVPVGDLVAETLYRKDYDLLINYMRTSETQEIYVDPATNHDESYATPYFDFYRMVLRDLETDFHRDHLSQLWEVWTRTPAHVRSTPR